MIERGVAMQSFPAAGGGWLTLNFDVNQANIGEATDVLVLPRFKEELVLVKHKTRGWEMPGGKVESGEKPVEAAVREAWEEGGIRFSHLPRLFAQYRITEQRDEAIIKNVYLGEVADFGPLPEGFETEAIKRVNLRWFYDHYEQIMSDPAFSYIMKDTLIQRVLEKMV
jgi:8-oxo-dGTP diphosphatase